jgi:hypothetical protein
MIANFPAPWSLRGRGHIFVYRFSESFLAQDAVVPAAQRASFIGGLGALMMVDYSESNCGPYRELLLIPGSRLVAGKPRPWISRILVSTAESVVNGRRNWSIPKEQADFEVVRTVSGSERWQVSRGAEVVFGARVQPGVLPLRFPLHTSLIPHVIAQPALDGEYLTRISAHGWGRMARLELESSAGCGFPDLRGERPLLNVGVTAAPFQMTFHAATVVEASEH